MRDDMVGDSGAGRAATVQLYMRGDTLGGGEGCNGSPFGVMESAGTDGVGAGGGVRGRATRGFCNATERAVRGWDEGSWIGVISDVRTLTPGRRETGASVSESPSFTSAGRCCEPRARLSWRV